MHYTIQVYSILQYLIVIHIYIERKHGEWLTWFSNMCLVYVYRYLSSRNVVKYITHQQLLEAKE